MCAGSQNFFYILSTVERTHHHVLTYVCTARTNAQPRYVRIARAHHHVTYAPIRTNARMHRHVTYLRTHVLTQAFTNAHTHPPPRYVRTAKTYAQARWTPVSSRSSKRECTGFCVRLGRRVAQWVSHGAQWVSRDAKTSNGAPQRWRALRFRFILFIPSFFFFCPGRRVVSSAEDDDNDRAINKN